MNRNVKVSIYTQAYNSEKYIKQCIESVLNQTYHNIEYILLDNASTDRTKTLIQEYALKDSRIIYLHHDLNKRGVMLNYLKKYATGDYIAVLDSDDFYELNFVEKTLQKIEEQKLDICAVGSEFFIEKDPHKQYRLIDKDIFFNHDTYPKYFSISYAFFRTAWGKLFSRNLLKNVDETLVSEALLGEVFYGQDTLFCFELIKNAQRIGIISDILHHYCMHSSSASYQYSRTRFKADIILYHYAEKLLLSFGDISIENQVFLFLIYKYAILDSIGVLLSAKIAVDIKYNYFCEIITHPLSKKMYDFLNISSEQHLDFTKKIFDTAVSFYKSGIYAKDVLKLLHTFIPKLCFDFYRLFPNHKDIKRGITEVVTHCEILENIPVNCLSNNLEIAINVYNSDYEKALDQLVEKLSSEKYVKNRIYLSELCLTLSALVNHIPAFLFAEKQKIIAFIEYGDKETAQLLLNEYRNEMPDDEDIKTLEEKL